MSAPKRIMSDDPVDPVKGAIPAHGVEPHHRQSPSTPEHHRRLQGLVLAVHRRAGHHDEGHMLDTTVGAQPYDEVVVKVDSGDVDDLVGRIVALIVTRQD